MQETRFQTGIHTFGPGPEEYNEVSGVKSRLIDIMNFSQVHCVKLFIFGQLSNH